MSLEICIAVVQRKYTIVGHDLLIGLNSRNVYSVSLRQQLQDPGGEDDLVQVWSMEDRVVVAWGESYNSWVNDCCIRFMLDFTLFRWHRRKHHVPIWISWQEYPKNSLSCMDMGSRGTMMLFKETEQGEVFDSTHQGLLSFLGALCLEDVSKDF
jgi:hypothetical protein